MCDRVAELMHHAALNLEKKLIVSELTEWFMNSTERVVVASKVDGNDILDHIEKQGTSPHIKSFSVRLWHDKIIKCPPHLDREIIFRNFRKPRLGKRKIEKQKNPKK